MTIISSFAEARQGLLTHRLRATLSSIGIVVGVGTVVASLAISEGAKRAAMADIGALGIDNVFARAAVSAEDPKAAAIAPALTRKDAEAIRSSIRGVEFVAVARSTRSEVASGSRRVVAPFSGISADWMRLANLQCDRGRCLSTEDEIRARRVAVIGATLSQRLAQGADPIGMLVEVHGQIFRVIGVLEGIEQRAGSAALQTFNPDEAVLVPSTVMDARLGAGDELGRVSEIGIRVTNGADSGEVSRAVSALLARRHPGERDRYELVVPRELLLARLRAQKTFDIVLLATGIIALIISGVGIMNIMLASVVEREQEIGVRRAVGAKRRDIVVQFALEAALLCMAGGVFGVPLGGAFAWAVSLLGRWPVTVSTGSILIALVLAATAGLAFGIYPAYRAASVDPIDALRA
jgi:putative ABC transport system permease protein